jgi:hypothetical protein
MCNNAQYVLNLSSGWNNVDLFVSRLRVWTTIKRNNNASFNFISIKAQTKLHQSMLEGMVATLEEHKS